MDIYINTDNLARIVKQYKASFELHFPNEIYKWKAVKHFQTYWEINAVNFQGMLKQAFSKTRNLLAGGNYYPLKMLEEFCKVDEEKVREMFGILFDEDKNLVLRIERFQRMADEMLTEWGFVKSHFQSLNAITTYLWLRYPDKYYIYKYFCAKKMAEGLEASFIPTKGMETREIVDMFKLYDEVAFFLQSDFEMKSILDNHLTQDCYPDRKMRTLTADLAYFEFVSSKKSFYQFDPRQKVMIEKSVMQKKSCNYWWLCANPKIWSMTGWMVGEEQDYTLYNTAGNKRRVFQHFLDARVGDKVVCYEANPTKQITGLAVISKESDGERICFRKVETLASPVELSEVKAVPELANMEFLVNPNGSFFHLTEKEYTTLLTLIREENDSIQPERSIEKYTKEDFLKEVFMSEQDFDTLQHLIRNKKNVILQGAPGVGKTFCARRLAQAMMGEKDESRIALIQFHQNYSYEDFVMGYKPAGATFELQKGIFYKFCMLAANHPEKEYFFIIDEINRGNLSKIFGELLMLIEKDYRGEKLTLAYKDEKFSIPRNLYLIGMMNTADRSLALIDYALRRRFSFFEMKPGFDSEVFKVYLKEKDNVRLNELVEQVKELNHQIAADDSLGKGFEIGHSYLCTREAVTDEWLKEVVNYDILPMLREYWFDNKSEVDRWSNKLNGIFNE